MLGGLRSDRLIRQIVTTGDVGNPRNQPVIEKLKQLGKSSVPRTISYLSTSHQDDSDLIVQLLSSLLDNRTLEHFFAGLSNPDARVVKGVTKALSSVKNSVDPNRFVDLFDYPNVSKPSVIQILQARKEGLNPANLLRHAHKLELADKAALFKIIGSIATEDLIPELINRVDTKDPVIRAQLTKVLSRFDGDLVQSTLNRLLSDSDRTVRLTALEGLSQKDALRDVAQLCKLLRDGDMNIQNQAVEVLIKLNHPHTVQHLLDPLRDESEYTRRAAVEVLNGIGTVDAIRDLLVAIKDNDWWVRTRAADALGKIGGDRVVDCVIELIKDDDEFIRRTAIEIINATQDERSYGSLVDALNDTDWWVKERAIDGLAALGNKEAVPVLIKMLKKDTDNHQAALVLVKALAKLGSSDAVRPVARLLASKSSGVVKESIQALEKLTDAAQAELVVEAVEKHSRSSHEEIKQLATGVAKRLRGRFLRGSEAQHMSDVMPEPLSMVESVVESGERKPDGTVMLPGTISREKAAGVPELIDIARLQEGDVLADRYKVIRQVGKGAFGTVFLTEDLMINEEIILKFLNASVASDENIIKRFVHELRFARRITHQNVIRIYDMITFGDSSAISMEYFASHTLTAEIHSRQTRNIDHSLAIIRDVCAGMTAAHEVHVVHRDLKPGNILIDDDAVVKVVDFGVAAATRQTDTRLTKTGLLIGTPTYMAPEQVLGREIDTRTDIYSLGIIMYEMLTGDPPYSGGDSMAIMYQHVQGKAEPARNRNPDIPHTLSAIIQKAMSTDPDKRYQSMLELSDRLEAFSK